MIAPYEQRNPYEGKPPRSWLILRLAALDGSSLELKLLADTGNPFSFVISSQALAKANQGDGPNANTNFGVLESAWFQLAMPELGLTRKVLGYASDDVVTATKSSQPDFEGLAGLPFLRLLEYGGDASAFWIRGGALHP